MSPIFGIENGWLWILNDFLRLQLHTLHVGPWLSEKTCPQGLEVHWLSNKSCIFKVPLSFMKTVSVSQVTTVSLKLNMIPDFPRRSWPIIMSLVLDDWDRSSTWNIQTICLLRLNSGIKVTNPVSLLVKWPATFLQVVYSFHCLWWVAWDVCFKNAAAASTCVSKYFQQVLLMVNIEPHHTTNSDVGWVVFASLSLWLRIVGKVRTYSSSLWLLLIKGFKFQFKCISMERRDSTLLFLECSS